MIRHQLIRASAGAGKTYELTSRYIDLLRQSEAPTSILAATFTRKAAGEILGRLLARLAAAAQNPAVAAELHATVDQCRRMLAIVCRDLHRVSIGTIDSFFGRMAQCFRHELALPANANMVGNDDAATMVLRGQAIDAMLAGEDVPALLGLVQRLYHDSTNRAITDFIANQVSVLYDLYREAPDKALWRKLDVPDGLREVGFNAALDTLKRMLADASARFGKRIGNDLSNAINHIESGNWEKLLSGGMAGKLAAGDATYYSKPIPEEIVHVIEPFVRHARSQLIGEVARRTEALHDLLQRYDRHFTELRERHRTLLFADLPFRLEQRLAFDETLRMDVYYRLDGRVKHLLLDEFQDTSPQQWSILRPFAEEITAYADPAESGRSLFCVGDMKQAIYGWRGGCAEIFDQLETDLHLPGDAAVSRSKSYRSSQIILDAVNQAFENIGALACLAEFAQTAQQWQQRFEHHEANDPKRRGYVELVTSVAALDDDDEDEDDNPETRPSGHLDFVAERIGELARHALGKSIGVLTVTNRDAARLIDMLQRRGDVHASGEGGSPLTDDPAVLAALAALSLADHPGHSAAAFHVVNSPLGSIVGLRSIEAPAVHDAAMRIRTQLLDDGYARTVGDWTRRLAPCCDGRSVIRMTQLVELADRYDADATLRPDDFVRYVHATAVDEPTPAPVRVMTIHKAKGLEFDIVVLPQLDKHIGRVSHDGVYVERPGATEPVSAVFAATNQFVRQLSPQLQAAYEQERARRINDDLCALYVAMTRAKFALHMIVKPLKAKKDGTPGSQPLCHAAVLRESLGRDDETLEGNQTLYRRGDAGWCVTGPPSATSPAPAQPTEPLTVRLVAPPAHPKRAWRRVAPSSLHGETALNVADVLDIEPADGRRYGSVIHAWMAMIEYLPAATLPDEGELFNAARRIDSSLPTAMLREWVATWRRTLKQPAIIESLRRPQGEADLWRERLFAVKLDGQLVQGVFDRVVVTAKRVDLLDYKTDHVLPGAGGAENIVERYRPQIEAYRRALSVMLQRQASTISAALLLLSTGERRTV